MSLAKRLAWALIAVIPLTLDAAPAAEVTKPPQNIKDFYHHTSWTSKDGAPAGIWTMAQTPDGWLWTGSDAGLFRFDGDSFEAVELRPPGSLATRRVMSLMTTRGGDLWVSFDHGGATVLIGGARDHASSPPGLPEEDLIAEFVEDGDEHVWALARSSARYVLRDGKWSPAGAEWGLPAGAIRQAKLDSHGSLWFAMQDGIYVLRKGARRFDLAQTNALAGARIGISQAGLLWKLDRNGFSILEGPEVSAPDNPNEMLGSATAAPILLTGDGSWWSVDCPAGICRARPDEPNQSVSTETMSGDAFTRADGLSSDRAMTLFEDREGDIWVGTKQGLDQFRRNELINVRFPTPLVYFYIVSDSESGIWAGTDVAYQSATDYLWRLDPAPSRVPNFSGAIDAAFREQDGSIIFAGRQRAWRMAQGHLQVLPLPENTGPDKFKAVIRDHRGHLWASFRSGRTFRLDDNQWVPNGNIANVPDAPAITMAVAETGTLWLGYSDNRLCRIDGNTASTYSSAQHLSTGAVTAILPESEFVLIGGELALNAFDGNNFLALHSDHPEALKGITGIARARDGSLWLNGSAGGAQIRADDLRHALADPSFRMPTRIFNAQDGMPGSAQSVGGSSTVVEDRQGRLWFAATDGLAWLDATQLREGPHAPQAQILSLSTPSQTVTPRSGLELAPRTQSLSIRYTAPSLAMPGRIRFRVRLSGIDSEWREMGTERSVEYSNLGPGAFRFQVLASNEAGEWNDRDAAVDFRILPAYYQMAWFKVLCGAFALAALGGIIRVQGARMAKREAARIAERVKERERIARELHDTLIQDVEALVLNLQALNARFGELDPAHHDIAQLATAAQRSLDLARDSVGGLRAGARTSAYLKDVLEELAEQLTVLYPVAYRAEVSGRPKPLQAAAAEEIVAIAREAILNAFRHARARLIVIIIAYSARALELKVLDDGTGFDIQGAIDREREGHWGLRGMRERAKMLRSSLAIIARRGGGTSVSLRVAAALAYAEEESPGAKAPGRNVIPL
jgi:signal transduction histidine kinase/ligand-binding sensor domain-containing protein